MILFLDDEQLRIDYFLKHHPNAIIASTSSDMIKILKTCNFKSRKDGSSIKYLFLDHDLDVNVPYVHGKIENTGMEVVEWVVKNYPAIDKVIVHSRNGYAAPIMANRLKSVGYRVDQIPFFDIKFPYDF